MRAADFDYELPSAAIAQSPAEPRDSSRLLIDRGPGREPDEAHTSDLPELVGRGDVLVLNTTRVMPARLDLRKATGGAAEVLLLGTIEAGDWEGLVRPGRRVPPGTELFASDGERVLTVGEDLGGGRRRLRFALPDPMEVLDRLGAVPLPPYITRPLGDPDRYQTVYADRAASVAAPTAGLHLTEATLDRCRSQGAGVARLELVVGLDTFRPITVEDLDDHVMHTEEYRIPDSTMLACEEARRVIAVGTTVVRALEAAARTGERCGRTDLFLCPGSPFLVVDALLTNFHMPRSSLLVLVEAFMGPRWRQLYAHALEAGFRFLSFGDAMFVTRQEPGEGR